MNETLETIERIVNLTEQILEHDHVHRVFTTKEIAALRKEKEDLILSLPPLVV